jgi:DNA gyrase/topoisomerase IV subunit B
MVSPELTKKLIKDYLNIALKTSIINPSFSSQTKEELMTPSTKFGIECEINSKFWDLLKQSDIINNTDASGNIFNNILNDTLSDPTVILSLLTALNNRSHR